MNPYIPQVWQFDLDYPAHLPSDEELGIDRINIKTNDGANFQATFDNHPAAIDSVAKWEQTVRKYQDIGIQAIPWCVPTWTNPTTEINITSNIIAVTNRMVFNVEFWQDQFFWQGGKAGVKPYCEALRAHHPNAHFTLQYDSRHPASIHVGEWLPYMDEIIAMDYWIDFSEPRDFVLNRSANRMNQLHSNYGFTYPGTANDYPAEPMFGSIPDIYIFRRGNMASGAVQAVQRMKSTAPPPIVLPPIEPPTSDPIADLYNELVRRSVQLEKLQQEVTDLKAVLRGV